MNAEEVMHIVAERAATLTSATIAVVALADGEDLVYRVVRGPGAHPEGARVPKTSSVAGRCVVERRVLRVDDASADLQASAELAGGAGGAGQRTPVGSIGEADSRGVGTPTASPVG